MIYAQIKAGRKLHLACEAGEEDRGSIVRYGYLSAPLCGQPMSGNYRMTINVSLANACRKCRLIARKRAATTDASTKGDGK